MIFNMSGSGSANLNFKVVGNPQPALPKENTIWIDTDVEITGWMFSSTEPENPIEGQVWISTSVSSPVQFNALKKNSFMVYAFSANQYINGVWTKKTAKIYQGEEWNGFILYVYKNGDISSITGGWQGKNGSTSWAASGTFTNGTTTLKVSRPSNSAGSMIWGGTKSTIDLTVFNHMCVHVSSISGSGYIAALPSDTTWNWSGISAETKVTTTGWNLLDISAVDGENYVAIGVKGYAGAENMTIDEIYLLC